MAFSRLALTIIGIIAIVIGLVWIGQGSGLFPYPASSFMINQSPWIAYGALAALIGLGLLWTGQRLQR